MMTYPYEEAIVVRRELRGLCKPSREGRQVLKLLSFAWRLAENGKGNLDSSGAVVCGAMVHICKGPAPS